jgi:hypothetical protein
MKFKQINVIYVVFLSPAAAKEEGRRKLHEHERRSMVNN